MNLEADCVISEEGAKWMHFSDRKINRRKENYKKTRAEL